jgi:hypothetical protein
MICPPPELLFESLAGGGGWSARARAEAHLHSCASCRAAADAFVAPADPLVRLVASVGPAAYGSCPSLEDIACWYAGDPLYPEEVRHISQHVSGCEACAFSVAQLGLGLSKGLGRPPAGISQNRRAPAAQPPAMTAASRTAVIAQVFGALVLVLVSGAIILPKLTLPDFTRGVTLDRGSAGTRSIPAEWPLESSFEFRLQSSSETHSLMFPHDPGVQLSRDYQYAIHFTARRPGWILLFSVGPDQRLSLLVPGGGASSQIPHLEAGQTGRFPSGSAWEAVAADPGQRRFYAVYLDNAAAAEALAAESRRASAAGPPAAPLMKKLDAMAAAGDCTSQDRPCVLTFDYEVF